MDPLLVAHTSILVLTAIACRERSTRRVPRHTRNAGRDGLVALLVSVVV